MKNYDTYSYSPREVLFILTDALLVNLIGPAWVAAILLSLINLLNIISIHNAIDRLIYGSIIGYLGCVIMIFSKENKRKSHFHPKLVAEREAKYQMECERIRLENEASEAIAYPIRMRKAKEMVIAYDKIPTASREDIQQACREIESCKNYREINAWDYSLRARKISEAIWSYHNPPRKGGFQSSGDNFYKSGAWRRVRADALHAWGNAPCCCCNKSLEGQPKHVDHIKPRSLSPELALKVSNLQVMCEECNLGKGNRYERDWRTKDQKHRMGSMS